MKKIILFFSAALLLIFILIYTLIPNRISFDEKVTTTANPVALMRKLADMHNWRNWWTADGMIADTVSQKFILNKTEYSIADARTLSLALKISNKILTTVGELTFIAADTGTTNLHFNATIPTSYNPFKRVQLFFTAKKIKKEVQSILKKISSHFSTTEHLYGYDIQNKSVVDSILLSTFKETKTYPSTEVIYSLIDELKNYIQQQSANETGNPMLNIFTKDSTSYLVKVAIPVDKKLPSSGNITYRWMLGGGNILITEVKGANSEIRKAYIQVQHYISDNNRVAPAIPFESLVTDRRKETDSSRWITKIYYPIM